VNVQPGDTIQIVRGLDGEVLVVIGPLQVKSREQKNGSIVATFSQDIEVFSSKGKADERRSQGV
jgi:hypothetical protein